MASIINATTSTGLVQTADNSGSLQLQTNNGTTAVTIDTSQNVGVGTASPGVKLDVNGGDFRIQQSASTARQRFVAGSNQWNVETSNSTNGYAIYDAAAGQLRAFIDTSGNFQFNSGYGSTATAYGCRAWVNFNGTGTVAIRASGNVSSITDNGTGAYAVNFTTAMPDANYSGNVSVASVPGTSDANFITTDCNTTSRVNPTTSSFAFTCYRFQGSAIDTEFVRVAVFR